MIDPIFPGTAEGREKRGGLKPKKSLFLNSLRFLQKVGRGGRHLLLGACFQYLFLSYAYLTREKRQGSHGSLFPMLFGNNKRSFPARWLLYCGVKCKISIFYSSQSCLMGEEVQGVRNLCNSREH